MGDENLYSSLARDIYQHFNGEIEIYHEYGLAEATVGCAIYKYCIKNDGHRFVPIGKPYANSAIFLLDKEGNIKIADFGDLGLNRNFGVELSSGKYVTFLDDDNLYGQNWIYESIEYIDSSENDIIVHPEYHITFDAYNLICLP